MTKRPPTEIQQDDILIEIQQNGAFAKVSAIDPVTLTEVTIVGDPAAGEETLKRTVMKKLKYVMNKNNPAPKEVMS